MKSQSLITGLLAAAASAGCGQKGPLYLPDQNTGTVITRPGTETSETAPQPGNTTPESDEPGERKEDSSRPSR